jgi:hypothetical protein
LEQRTSEPIEVHAPLASKSGLGAILATGFAGGRIPAAESGVAVRAATQIPAASIAVRLSNVIV